MDYGYDLYRLDSLGNIVGNDAAVARMLSFSEDIERGSRRAPLMLFGPSGTGKSAAARLLASRLGWSIVEMNASDYRDRESIEKRLLSAATSRSLFGGRNLILLDEIDEMASGFDKGGSSAISSLIEKSRNPIVFIANDMWDQSISFLRGRVEPVEFRRLSPDDVRRALANVCGGMGIKASAEAVDIIANRSNGDVRSALNDLSVIADSDDDSIMEAIGLRDRKIDVFNVLDRIFMSNTLAQPLRAIMNSDVANDMMIKWIDENIPRRYIGSAEMKRAYGSLAYASMYGTRAQRAQYYTYWRYMNVLMSSGIALSKDGYPDTRSRYSFPKVIKDLSLSKGSRAHGRAVAAKLRRKFHSSMRKIISSEMRMMSIAAAKCMRDGVTRNELKGIIADSYSIDEKDAEYIIDAR